MAATFMQELRAATLDAVQALMQYCATKGLHRREACNGLFEVVQGKSQLFTDTSLPADALQMHGDTVHGDGSRHLS
jgi:hypothetical protein